MLKIHITWNSVQDFTPTCPKEHMSLHRKSLWYVPRALVGANNVQPLNWGGGGVAQKCCQVGRKADDAIVVITSPSSSAMKISRKTRSLEESHVLHISWRLFYLSFLRGLGFDDHIHYWSKFEPILFICQFNTIKWQNYLGPIEIDWGEETGQIKQ